jgi:signal transduction histidine kinase
MSGVEILVVVAIVMQSIAVVIAFFLVNHTKYRVLWISCILGLLMLITEQAMQLRNLDSVTTTELVLAWIDIVVSICFSASVLFARFLVNHVDRMTYHRRILEKRLMTAVLRTEERSRAELSRDLHDGLGPLLSSAKMSLSALSRADLSQQDRQTLNNTAKVIDEAIRSLREISNNLSPHVLNNFGLVRGIRNFIDRVASLHPVNIDFRTPLRTERFDSNIEVIIYRVLCELINNSLKHSQCKSIAIELMLDDENIVLNYRDDGCGFSLQDVADSGMGLSNIRSRISSLGGVITIESAPNEGMSANIRVRLDSVAMPDSANQHKTNRRRRWRNPRLK